MVDFSVLQYKDVRLAMGAVIVNTTLVIAAWFGRAYWMHGIEAVVNKLQARQFAYTSTPKETSLSGEHYLLVSRRKNYQMRSSQSLRSSSNGMRINCGIK